MKTKAPLLLPFALFLALAVTACPSSDGDEGQPSRGGSGQPGRDSASKGDVVPAPAECAKTPCDIAYEQCSKSACIDRCSECHARCSGVSDVVGCLRVCSDICATPQPPCTSPCGELLDACRRSQKNAVCAPIEAPPAPKARTCDGTAGRWDTVCSSLGDRDPFLLSLPSDTRKNEECSDCAFHWEEACYDARPAFLGPCDPGPLVRCESTGDCPEQARAFDACLQKAMADPESACGRAARACWSATPSCFDDAGDSTGATR